MADVLKAQVVADVAPGSSPAATGSPAEFASRLLGLEPLLGMPTTPLTETSPARQLRFEQAFGQPSPAAASQPRSPPSSTLPAPPITVESFSDTVQQLMRDLAELRIQSEKQLVTISLKIESQRLKLEEQAEAIAGFEAGAAEAKVESTAEAELDWGYDQDGRWIGGHHDPWWSWHNGDASAYDPWKPPGLAGSTPQIAAGLPRAAPAQEDSQTAGCLPSAAPAPVYFDAVGSRPAGQEPYSWKSPWNQEYAVVTARSWHSSGHCLQGIRVPPRPLQDH